MDDLLEWRACYQLVPMRITCELHHLEYVQVANPANQTKRSTDFLCTNIKYVTDDCKLVLFSLWWTGCSYRTFSYWTNCVKQCAYAMMKFSPLSNSGAWCFTSTSWVYKSISSHAEKNPSLWPTPYPNNQTIILAIVTAGRPLLR